MKRPRDSYKTKVLESFKETTKGFCLPNLARDGASYSGLVDDIMDLPQWRAKYPKVKKFRKDYYQSHVCVGELHIFSGIAHFNPTWETERLLTGLDLVHLFAHGIQDHTNTALHGPEFLASVFEMTIEVINQQTANTLRKNLRKQGVPLEPVPRIQTELKRIKQEQRLAKAELDTKLLLDELSRPNPN